MRYATFLADYMVQCLDLCNQCGRPLRVHRCKNGEQRHLGFFAQKYLNLMAYAKMNTAKKLKDAEFWLLCLLALVLPILEAPKNIVLVLIAILWIVRRVFFEPLHLRQPDGVEFALIGLMLASTISTALNWPSPGELKGVKDVLFGVFICWLVYRGDFSARRRYLLAAMVALGVVIGLVWSTADVLRGVHSMLEFNSAGVVTQSSIYLGIALVLTFGVAYTGVRQRALWWLVAILMLFGLFLMGSRGSILAVTIICLLLLPVMGGKRVYLVSILTMALVTGIAWVMPNKFNQMRFFEKNQQLTQTHAIDQNDTLRFDMWRIGVAQFLQGGSPIFGIGPRNFSTIDLSSLKLDPTPVLEVKRMHHAHNMFLTKLVEEGIFGLAALLFLFYLVGAGLVRDWRAGQWRDWQWFGALGALLVPAIAGSFNTPWYQEHALLAMVLFGVYFSSRKPVPGLRNTAVYPVVKDFSKSRRSSQ